jgi:tRNA threonylcarbamoyladenosine biosynthesis protein TsaB
MAPLRGLVGRRVLALDTSSVAVTVAVTDGVSVLATATVVDGARPGELLAPTIAAVLADAGIEPRELTDIAVGVGPGPFTGLRIGVMTARMLGAALGAVVHGVCSLDILAAEVYQDRPFVVVTDARRREVYWSHYRGRSSVSGVATEAGVPAVCAPAEVAAQLKGVAAVGRGGELYPEHFPLRTGPVYPDAGVLARLAMTRLAVGGPILPPVPLYLRRPDVAVPGVPKPVTSPAR